MALVEFKFAEIEDLDVGSEEDNKVYHAVFEVRVELDSLPRTVDMISDYGSSRLYIDDVRYNLHRLYVTPATLAKLVLLAADDDRAAIRNLAAIAGQIIVDLEAAEQAEAA